MVRRAPRRYRRMRIAFLTGIWPPDVGGPATHGPDFARFLVARGHAVHVVTMGDGEPTDRPCGVEVGVSRRAAVSAALRAGRAPWRARAARERDVIYASATYAAAARGLCARAPAARRQARLRPGLRARAALRRVPRLARGVPAGGPAADARAEGPADAVAAAARTIVVPSAYLAEIAARLGARPRADPRADEPGAPAARSRARGARARDVRLRRPAHRQKALGPRSRRSRRCRRRGSCRRRRARARRRSSARRPPARARAYHFRGALP